MEEFFKSALPAQGSYVLGDSSLALPTELKLRSPAEAHSTTNRSQRVHQQVQLTLARKARKSVSNGNMQFVFFLSNTVSVIRKLFFKFPSIILTFILTIF